MTEPQPKAPRFSGTVVVQFSECMQVTMETDEVGTKSFVALLRGRFGSPPTGDNFQAQVKLSLGAAFDEDAYEVLLPDALAPLAARPELRVGARDYVDQCMTRMFGPNWKQLNFPPGAVSSNVVHDFSPPIVIEFPPSSDAW
jgi:hypothetical protein